MNISKDNPATFKYDGGSLSPKSSVIIFAGSLKSNMTYQFMIEMTNRQNSSVQIYGYLLVQIEEIACPLIVIS